MKDYIEKATRTLSEKWYGSSASFYSFLNILASCELNLQRLDIVKKNLFYGKNQFAFDKDNCSELGNCLNQSDKNITHAIIGIATESGELLEALQYRIANGNPFDKVNLKEELGDVMWYIAIAAKEIGVSMDDIMQTNINKLAKRYPDKFNEVAAINRDLKAEREELEK